MLLYRGALVYAEDRADYSPDRGHSGAEHLLHDPDKYRGPIPSAVHDTITVSPIVNHGRWLVPCPWCFSAGMASRHDHRFYCVECRNVGAGGKWVRVVWPESKDEIEALLTMRPDPRTRNWKDPETVAELLAENESFGVI